MLEQGTQTITAERDKVRDRLEVLRGQARDLITQQVSLREEIATIEEKYSELNQHLMHLTKAEKAISDIVAGRKGHG